MEKSFEIKLRHRRERVDHLDKCYIDRLKLREIYDKAVELQGGYQVISTWNKNSFQRYASELVELCAINNDLWAKMITRQMEELAAACPTKALKRER